jgi:hypothetical protein
MKITNTWGEPITDIKKGIPMKFNNTADISGTHLQGHIDAAYSELVAAFGEPADNGDDYKVDAQWRLQFEDGTRATIYNYKDGVNYNGKEEGTPTALIRDWHIGGTSFAAVERIVDVLNAQPKPEDVPTTRYSLSHIKVYQIDVPDSTPPEDVELYCITRIEQGMATLELSEYDYLENVA